MTAGTSCGGCNTCTVSICTVARQATARPTAPDLLQNIYNLNGKAIPGGYKSGVDQDDKYFTPKGMARSGVR